MKKNLLGALLVASSLCSSAQEGQLTQFFNSNLYTNPAEAGSSAYGGLRITSNYRRQWASIAAGFVTKSINADILVGKMGLGVLVTSSDAGQASLNRSRFMFNLARQLPLDSHNVIGFGMQAGLAQYSMNPSSLQFDNQYVAGQGFNTNTSNGENFAATNVMNFDGALGLTWRNTAYSWQPKVSFSVGHLFQPKETVLASSSASTKRQYNLYVEVTKKISPKVELIPYAFISKQSQSTNLQLGSRVGYQFKEDKKLYLGAGIRPKDALMAYVGFSLKDMLLGMSYDMNSSLLKPATSGQGAWELSLIVHIGMKSKKVSPRKKEQVVASEEEETPARAAVEEANKKVSDTSAKAAAHTPMVQTEEAPASTSSPVESTVQKKQAPIMYSSIHPQRIKTRYFVYFDTDRSVIKGEYQLGLDKLAEELKSDSTYQLLITGHTDSDGDGLYNVYLGDARAHQVMQYLVEKGVDMSAIKTFTYGKSNPQRDNGTLEGKAKNRRVEILLIRGQ